jgi:hypothetical protein
MKAIWMAATAAVFLAAPAFAGTMESTYGNTVIVTNGKGEVTTLLFEADGSYTAKGADGAAVQGKWAIKEGKYCATPNAVAGQPEPTEACSEFVDGKNVGDSWTQKGIDGTDITVEIKAGRT